MKTLSTYGQCLHEFVPRRYEQYLFIFNTVNIQILLQHYPVRS